MRFKITRNQSFFVSFKSPKRLSYFFLKFFSASPVIEIDGPISIKTDNKVGEINHYFKNYEVTFELNVIGELTWEMQRSISGFLKPYEFISNFILHREII